MAELSAAARSIYVDVREAIQGLSEPIGDEVDARRRGPGLRRPVRRGVEARGLGPSGARARGATGSTPAVRDEVFGIIREALTNVRKHAAARRVAVDGRPRRTTASSRGSPTTGAASTRTTSGTAPATGRTTG